MAKNIIDLGYKIGIGGVLTFKNSKLYEVLEKVDIEDIVLETDCPYLSPEPNRGKRNEPAFLIHVVRKIASIKNMSEDDVMNITNQNAKSILEV